MAATLFPAGLLGLAMLMMLGHLRSWRTLSARSLSATERAFRGGQFRRRMQASSLLALVAPVMLLGVGIPAHESPKLFVALWISVMLSTCWIGWLAIVDAVASGKHYRKLSRERASARERLKNELDRLLAEAQAAHAAATGSGDSAIVELA